MKNTVIIGNYGATNLGDEAILENIIKLHPEVNFTVFSHNPEWTTKHYKTKSNYPLPFGIRSFLRGNFKESFRALKKTDCVIIGGGGLFTDEKPKAVWLWGWHFFWAKFYKKPVFIYANSIGPICTKMGKWISKKVFTKADYITVRDEESADFLKTLNVTNFAVTADPAFLSQIPQKNTLIKKQIAISLRPWMKYQATYVRIIKEIIINLEKSGYRVILISMQKIIDNDREILLEVSSEKSIIISPCDFNELIAILDRCSLTMGMRLHFLIASALVNVPFISLSYSQKTDSLVKNLGMEEFGFSLKEISKEKIEELITKITEKQADIKQKIFKKTQLITQKATENKIYFEKFIAKCEGKG